MPEAKKNEKKPGPLTLLIGSRKAVVALLTVLCALGAMAGAKLGFNWNVEAMVAAASPIVLSGMSLIFGIAYEDGQQKAAGAGTTTTHEITKAGGTVAEVTTIKPDPSGKP